MNNSDICVVIPTYNNENTLGAVIDSVLEFGFEIVVVNDGSTDNTNNILYQYRDKIKIISYAINRGKGFALKSGFNYAQRRGYKYTLTIDSDGQHCAGDIPLFVEAVEKYPNAMIVGNRNLAQDNMPKRNSFANRFSNFWFAVQTGQKLPDTQTGFRLYPLGRMKNIRPFTSRYEAELELLVRSAWRGIRIVSIPIRVYYAPAEKRVSHFRPGVDFLRISMLNTLFTILALFYGYPAKLLRYLKKKDF